MLTFKNSFATFLVVFALLALSIATATAQTLPCLLSQVSVNSRPEPTQVPGGPVYGVVVSSMISYQTNCLSTTYESETGKLTVHTLYVVERRNPETGLYEAIRSYQPAVPFDGSGRPRRAQVVEIFLSRESYRVRSYDRGNMLESLPFSVGSTATDFAQPSPFAKPIPTDDRFKLAYGQPSAIVRSGAMYFRSLIRDGKTASGYLFQDQADGTTTVLPATFEQLDASDGGFTSLPQVAGGMIDLAWTRVKFDSHVGSGTFDVGLPVTGCVTTSGGVSCFEVFDTTVPYHDFNPNEIPFSGPFGR